ncbi:hypothetical protein TNCV_4668371 [Trichonephila clavipes]|nr:hypothetical protein TNCV_4668371 [Trichonephila clavipes]
MVTWTTPDVSALDRFNVHRCPTRRVFSGTGLEPVTKQATVRYLYHSATAADRVCEDAKHKVVYNENKVADFVQELSFFEEEEEMRNVLFSSVLQSAFCCFFTKTMKTVSPLPTHVLFQNTEWRFHQPFALQCGMFLEFVLCPQRLQPFFN